MTPSASDHPRREHGAVAVLATPAHRSRRRLGFIALSIALGCPGAVGSPSGLAAQTPVRTAVPRQRIGVDPNPKAESDYMRGAREEAFDRMRTTAVNHTHYAKVWAELEPSPGIYDTDEVGLIAAETGRMRMAFNLRVLNAGGRSMPDAYKTLAWDSPQMVGHIIAVIKAIAPILGSRPWSVRHRQRDRHVLREPAGRSGVLCADARGRETDRPRPPRRRVLHDLVPV